MWRPTTFAVLLAAIVIGCEAVGDVKGSIPKTVYATPNQNEDMDFWRSKAQDELSHALQVTLNTNKAKNVILFLGDGLGIPTITAARIYKGQQQNNVSGEEGQLFFETFPHVALSKTYNVNMQVADSASTGTAYLTGVKTRHRMLGVDGTAREGECFTVTDANKVSSIAHWAQEAGKRTGIVTSTRITHATPAASYAHIAHRDWECDGVIEEQQTNACPDLKDIARQLVEDQPGRSFNVIMGGGYQELSATAADRPGDPVDTEECLRQDNRDLFQQWQDDRDAEGSRYAAIRTKTELMSQDMEEVDHLMGIFANSHIPWEFEKREKGLDIPTLGEMTQRALDVLDRGDQGFFLLVEGGRIDHAHHDGTARKALDETLSFEEAIKGALERVDTEETLVVVTADHSHVMTMNGYPERGQDITGLGDTADDLPYTTLMYTTGNGFNYTTKEDSSTVTRHNITNDDVTDFEYIQLSAVHMNSETHGGEDVAIYAIGPMSHLFHGVHEQNYIPHVMGYAACIGQNTDHCKGSGATPTPTPTIVAGAILLYQSLARIFAN